MLKFTERLGDVELVYEGETVQDIVNLKNAMNPSVLVIKPDAAMPKEGKIGDYADATTWMQRGVVV